MRLTREELSKGFPIFFMAIVRLAIESCAELILVVSGLTARIEYTREIPDYPKRTNTSCFQVCVSLGSLKGGAHDFMCDECSHACKVACVKIEWIDGIV